MCVTCGCGGEATHRHEHPHEHPHAHPHPHASAPAEPRELSLERRLLARNDAAAARNRAALAQTRVLALNLLSSPGSGKTTLIEKTVRELSAEMTISVVEGDQETQLDAERIRGAGARAVQINTGAGCHLDAEMTARGLSELRPEPGSVVLVENVGNLVCPALFDLGEEAKVVMLSVTEGEDKPLKYPHAFRAASLMLLTKVDLLPHVAFDAARCLAYARQVNPALETLQVSSARAGGLAPWYDWLRRRRARGLIAL